jgi:hypothetical protein
MAKKMHPLYKGKHPVIFESRGHKYTNKDGNIIANATGVLKMLSKPKIAPWMARMAAEKFGKLVKPGVAYDEIQIMRMVKEAKEGAADYSDERKDVGTVAHEWMEKYINQKVLDGGPNPVPSGEIINPNVRKSVQGFLEWESEHEVEWHHAERLVYSYDCNHCGTIDGVATVDGMFTVVDFKTGKGIWPEAGVQAASYVAAYLEEHPEEDGANRLILHLPAFEGSWKAWDEKRIKEKLTGYGWEEDYVFFLNLLGAWQWAQGGPNKWTWFGKQ